MGSGVRRNDWEPFINAHEIMICDEY